MNNYLKDISISILSLNRNLKRVIAVITDLILCILCTWLAFVLRLEELILFKDFNYYPALISIIIAVPIFWFFGLYRTIFRFTGLSIIATIILSTFIYGLLYFFVVGVYGIYNVPRSVGVLQPMLLFFAIIFSRLFVRYILVNNHASIKKLSKKKVLVYGAGESGRQLVISLENNLEFEVVGFLDDNKELQGRDLLGRTIYSSLDLEKLIRNKNISLVFLALTKISRVRRNQIIQKLNNYNLIVKTLPSVSEIVDGRITISDIKDLNIEDLLNRDQVIPDPMLLSKNINFKTVLVTGAGGSIGSELCRQIIKLKPKKLILLELNEYVLYQIFESLSKLNKDVKIIPLIANVQQQLKLEKIFELFNVETIYHTAAYKHVPLVEENICEGVMNNVFGTLAVVKASINKKVSNLVLISSDKAVRPTNIMGASKRLAELCMQGFYYSSKNIVTNCSIVRFGNVLESSGSVIPKFKKQIKEGGPVTLTHKDVTRYFMTITEAAQLVIQAGAMGKKSEVFVLDMGESVKIKDLIYKMINLSGFTVKDNKNKKGDIKIKIIGLRPGEKLYEELLIGENPKKTNHSKIHKTDDPFIPFDQLENNLIKLRDFLENYQVNEVKSLLEKIVKSYKPNSKIIDHIYLEESSSKAYSKNLSISKNRDNKVIKIK